MKLLRYHSLLHLFYKSITQNGFSFACDVPKIWNEFPDDICSATSLLPFWKNLKAYLFKSEGLSLYKSLSTLGFIIFLNCLCGVDPPFLCLWTMNSLDLFSWLWRLTVCLLLEIKRYKSHIKIRIIKSKANISVDPCTPTVQVLPESVGFVSSKPETGFETEAFE